MRIDCPICKKVLHEVVADFGPRPFCSPRCKLVDLGNWLNGEYRIPVASGHEVEEREGDGPKLS